MSLWKRFFSADYRAAVSAEAAGQLEQAAEHYVLAGEHLEAARVHLARAERAPSRALEIDALRDALHWAGHHQELGAYLRKSLGRALLARARAEGIATERDRLRVREAAELLVQGGDCLRAGEALESIGDMQGAAMAYGKGGLVERMEAVLARDDERSLRERSLREGFANYEMHMRIGDRSAARDDLRQCIEAADNQAEYRRLLDQLESHLITGGQVMLRPRQGALPRHPDALLPGQSAPPSGAAGPHAPAGSHGPAAGVTGITVIGGDAIVLGRDPLCTLPLRAGGVSRQHAEIVIGPPGESPRFHLRDLGSRNGTRIGGLPIRGTVALSGQGELALCDDCRIEYQVHPDQAPDQTMDQAPDQTMGQAMHRATPRARPASLLLRVVAGVDRGQALLAGGSDQPLDLHAILGLAVRITFRQGRPMLARSADSVRLFLGGESMAQGEIQLIHGDELRIDGVEIDVP